MELVNTKYDRSLYPGKAVFYYKTADNDFVPLKAEVSYIRGKKASFSEGYSADGNVKNNAPQNLAFANPLAIEECYVPPKLESVYCRFSLRIQANSLEPSACSNIDTSIYLKDLAMLFKKCGGYDELALRYTKNILLGTWLWRNQNSGNTEILVKTSQGSIYQINNTRQLSWESEWPEEAHSSLVGLAKEVAQALTEPLMFWSADITARISTSFCQEIFPSQPLFTSDKKTDLHKTLSKMMCVNGEEAVVFHSVKVGAAIQLIDDWWSTDMTKRLRTHEYGADQNLSIAMRMPKSGLDFFSIYNELEYYKTMLDRNKVLIDAHLMYFFAVLIKGGVFAKRTN